MNEMILNELNLNADFLMYLDTEHILSSLQKSAIHYKTVINRLAKNESIPPFRFLFHLDMIKIQEISEKLYEIFMKEPVVGLELAKNVVFQGLKLLLPNADVELSDLQLVPCILNLPPTTEIMDLLLYPTHGLESIEGILIAKTSVTTYLRSSMFSCKNPSCINKNKRRRYPENVGNNCLDCLVIMEEDISSRDTGEEIISHFISLKAYESLGRFQALKVRIKDELCTSCDFELGEEYLISGRLNENYFEAMNLQSKLPNCKILLNFKFTTLPETVKNFYYKISEELPNCPWSFVVGLASMLAFDLIPDSSFLHLKIGLMLSLSSQQEEEPPVPLIAVGADSLNAQYLFQSAGKLAKRYIKHSVTQSYLGGVAKPGPQPDVIWEEAGQLILGAKGVCNLGDWSKFKKEQANYICQTIESGQIILNKGELGKKNLINIVPLKTSVWTYWSHITTSRNDQLQLKTLINVFGIPFLAEEKNETEVKRICWKYLNKAMNFSKNTLNTEVISSVDLKEFIKNINCRKPALTDAASQVIRNYFVASRRERPQCLPIGAIKTITALAEAHARLRLRDEVEYEDVVSVLYLYEESLSTLFGPTMNSYKKIDRNHKESIYAFMSRQINEFRVWLDDYIQVH